MTGADCLSLHRWSTTDNPNPAVDRWISKYARKANLIAVGLGKDADFSVLKKLGLKNVIVFEDEGGRFQRNSSIGFRVCLWRRVKALAKTLNPWASRL